MSELTETQSQQQDTSTSSKSTQPKQQAERIPGHTILPIARIKRVIKEDKEISLINGEATFCVAAATELFMEYLVNEALNKSKKEKRKTIFYRDLASTVKEIEQFEFLEDVIPTTMTLKQAIEKRKETLNEEASIFSTPPSKKQKTSSKSAEESATEAVEEEEEADAEAEGEEEDEEENGNGAEEQEKDDDDEEMEDPKAD